MRYRDRLTGLFVSRSTWLRSRAQGGSRYVTVRGKPIPRPAVKSTRARPGRVPVKAKPRKRPAPGRERPAKRPAPPLPRRKPAKPAKPRKRPPARKPKARPKRRQLPMEEPVLIRWRYQGKAGKTDIEIVVYRGRVVACRIGPAGGRSYAYDDPRALVDLQKLFATMPSGAAKARVTRGVAKWWEGL